MLNRVDSRKGNLQPNNQGREVKKSVSNKKPSNSGLDIYLPRPKRFEMPFEAILKNI